MHYWKRKTAQSQPLSSIGLPIKIMLCEQVRLKSNKMIGEKLGPRSRELKVAHICSIRQSGIDEA